MENRKLPIGIECCAVCGEFQLSDGSAKYELGQLG